MSCKTLEFETLERYPSQDITTLWRLFMALFKKLSSEAKRSTFIVTNSFISLVQVINDLLKPGSSYQHTISFQ